MSRGSIASLALALLVAPSSHADSPTVTDFVVRGDAVAAPLAGLTGNATRGEAVVRDRVVGNCLICHSVPIDETFPGDIGPPLAGVGNRLRPGQIRLRLIDQSQLNPDALMPPYYRIDGLTDVAPEFAGLPALTAQQIEDVVAYLTTLTDP